MKFYLNGDIELALGEGAPVLPPNSKIAIELRQLLDQKILDVLDLRVVRSVSAINSDNLVYLGELVVKSEGEMLRIPNFGRRALNEVKTKLAELTPPLRLGMEVGDWQPPQG